MKIFLYLHVIVLLTTLSAAPWQKIKDVDDIHLYEKQEPNFDFSQFKGEGLVHHNVDTIVSTIMRPLSYPNWLGNCTSAKRLFTATLKVHMLTQPPWPLKERQVILKVKKKKHDGFVMITFNSITPQDYFTKSDAVWFKFLNAQFTLVPVSENETVVRLELAAHPGGNIPQYLVNMTGWMIPYESLRDLRTYLNEIHKDSM